MNSDQNHPRPNGLLGRRQRQGLRLLRRRSRHSKEDLTCSLCAFVGSTARTLYDHFMTVHWEPQMGSKRTTFIEREEEEKSSAMVSPAHDGERAETQMKEEDRVETQQVEVTANRGEGEGKCDDAGGGGEGRLPLTCTPSAEVLTLADVRIEDLLDEEGNIRMEVIVEETAMADKIPSAKIKEEDLAKEKNYVHGTLEVREGGFVAAKAHHRFKPEEMTLAASSTALKGERVEASLEVHGRQSDHNQNVEPRMKKVGATLEECVRLPSNGTIGGKESGSPKPVGIA